MDPHASEFKRISRTLNKHKVDYMLIGGYAVIFHGFTRTTDRLDVEELKKRRKTK